VTVSGYSPSLVELFTDDVVAVSPVMQVRGRDALIEQLRHRDHVFSEVDLDLEVSELADGRVLAEWSVSAVHRGALIVRGGVLPPTSRRVSLTGVVIARFLGSQICEFRQYWDALELLRKMGVPVTELVPDAFRSPEDVGLPPSA
jgi:hypothetical protein